jgi:RNA polymerase sigma-70 factor (ECF subfamily)
MDGPELAAVRLARAGDKDAFRVLVDRHGRAVFGLAFRITGQREDAEDVVQETFLRAWRQIHRFEERASFSTWIYRIGVNCALDRLRQRPDLEVAIADDNDGPGRDEPAADDTVSPERAAYGGEVRRRVSEAMTALSPAERAAFVLRHFEGRSIEEIGRTLGLRTSATKHSIFRAVQKMRRALEPLVT